MQAGDSPIGFAEDSLDLFGVGGLQLLVEGASFGIKTSAALETLDLRLFHSLDTLSKTLKHCLHILLLLVNSDCTDKDVSQVLISSSISKLHNGTTCHNDVVQNSLYFLLHY